MGKQWKQCQTLFFGKCTHPVSLKSIIILPVICHGWVSPHPHLSCCQILSTRPLWSSRPLFLKLPLHCIPIAITLIQVLTTSHRTYSSIINSFLTGLSNSWLTLPRHRSLPDKSSKSKICLCHCFCSRIFSGSPLPKKLNYNSLTQGLRSSTMSPELLSLHAYPPPIYALVKRSTYSSQHMACFYSCHFLGLNWCLLQLYVRCLLLFNPWSQMIPSSWGPLSALSN